jgi:hypothetical protein
MSCKPAPLSNKLANPPYSIHNFAWKEGISNNDDAVLVKLVDGNLTAQLDTKAISVTASKRVHLVWREHVVHTAYCWWPVCCADLVPLLSDALAASHPMATSWQAVPHGVGCLRSSQTNHNENWLTCLLLCSPP